MKTAGLAAEPDNIQHRISTMQDSVLHMKTVGLVAEPDNIQHRISTMQDSVQNAHS